jgi:hypothetical protein
MMFASHYMSEWTSVLSLYEMPIRSGVRARTGPRRRTLDSEKAKGRFLRVLTAGLKSRPSKPRPISALPFSNFAVPFFGFVLCECNPTEVKNEKLQH